MNDAIHPLTEKVRAGVDYFNVSGSVALFVDQFAPDAVFVVPGQSAVSGTYVRQDGVRRFFEKMHQRAGGELTFEVVEALSNDDHLVLFLRFAGKIDGRTLDCVVAGFCSDNSPDGWRRATILPDNQAAFDSFFET